MTVGGGGEDDDPKKRHNKRQSGRKAEKKKLKKSRQQQQGDGVGEEKGNREGGGTEDGAKGAVDKGGKKDKLAPDPVRNPKAFAFNNVKKLEKKFRRTADIKEKRKRVPEVDRTPLEPPPFVVALVGPPKV